VRAIDGKNLENLFVYVSNPARNIRSLTIPGVGNGIAKCGKPGLARRKLSQLAQ
jgi:hypothetical protein